LNIAIVGSGISGLSAAWLLSHAHEVTLFEAAERLGGHTNTIEARTAQGATTPVDTGFIVYNEKTYPNLVAMFHHLGVATRGSDMSFAVSLDAGRLEYGSTDLPALFAQKRNLLRPRFWSMLRDLQRFYREAPKALEDPDEGATLGEYLDREGYGVPFQRDHLLPQAAAIWSSDPVAIRAYPFTSFVRFFVNHGLLELDIHARPQWRTVVGGSGAYIPALTRPFSPGIRAKTPVRAIVRGSQGVELQGDAGDLGRFDHVVVAAHAPQALALLAQPTPLEAQLLGAIRYTPNLAVLHTDISLMPRRRSAWSAWNFVGESGGRGEVTYWMNRLQGLTGPETYLVSLNPPKPPAEERVISTQFYEHPLFDQAAVAAQKSLWALQGVGGVWFCGAYFGAGFHEDGLQAGLAVAEALGGTPRPWTVDAPNGRIYAPQAIARAA